MLNKFIYSDAGSLTDASSLLDDYYAGSLSLVFTAADDKVYLGSKYPFTRKFLKVSTANASASVLSVKYWDGTAWRTATNVQDGTAVAGKTLAQSGYLTWETDKRYSWACDDTTSNGTEKITGLGNTTLYDFYWVEVSLSANVTAALDWAGDVFCTDNDLGSEFPDLNRAEVQHLFSESKSDWEEQRITASRLISQDLKRLMSPGTDQRILGADQLLLPCVSKTAEVIFRALGAGYEKNYETSRDEYKRRMDPSQFVTDQTNEGRASAENVQASRQVSLSR